MAGEGSIFAIEGDRADQVFVSVGADLHVAVAKEGLQPVVGVMDIGSVFGHPKFVGTARLPGVPDRLSHFCHRAHSCSLNAASEGFSRD